MKMKSSMKMKMPVSIFRLLENGDMAVDFIFAGPNGCLKKDMHYKMLAPGYYTRSTSAQSEIRIVKVDYTSDAIEYSRRVSESGEISIMVKMLSRNQDIHPSCYEAFKMVAAAVGLTDANKVIMEKDVECIPENM
ncbi:lipocalin-15-like [Ambystoma mexicanum]|uniref:lipocalin-15-like n=1 Tax=Ambystoma mexicanum TaxID=8296 RepID=UPI0037E81FB9